MRATMIFAITLITLSVICTSVYADSRGTDRGWTGYRSKEKQEVKKTEKKESAEKEKAEKSESAPYSETEILMKMLMHEDAQGILDYRVDIIEVTEKASQSKTESVQKQIYYLAPARSLTLKDSIPVYYIDDYLFEKIILAVKLDFMKDEVVNDVPCFVIKMTPIEKAFEKNVKFYYIAKDDFRKIRIEATRFNAYDQSIINVTDFTYRKIEDRYLLPLRSESRTYDEREFLLQTTTATFMNWRFNMGLTPAFFEEKLKDYKLYDIIK